MLFDTQRLHADPLPEDAASLPEYHAEKYSTMSDSMQAMREIKALRESALPFLMCTGGLKLKAMVFEPFSEIFLGSCGPERLPHGLASPFSCDLPYFMFMVLLEGAYRFEMDGTKPALANLSKNSFIAADWTNARGRTSLPAQNAYCHVAIAMLPDAVEEHFGKSVLENLHRALRWLPDGTARDVPMVSGTSSLDLISAAKRLVFMRKAGLLDTMDLRAATLDFFTRMLRNIASPASAPAMALPEHDVLALTRLKERIERNCLEEMSVKDLCASVGMSESKANKAFKQLFNVTVARHVHNCKMQYANAMLCARKRNVSECAFEIGYANIGHFIAAYRRHYGDTPGNAYKRAAC